jgi:hypothetical protein
MVVNFFVDVLAGVRVLMGSDCSDLRDLGLAQFMIRDPSRTLLRHVSALSSKALYVEAFTRSAQPKSMKYSMTKAVDL